jgi:hypothetical protein
VAVVAYSPEHYLANKEAYAKKSKEWRETNPEQAKANRRKNYLENKERNLQYSTTYNRLKKTGVTNEQYQTQLLKQQGVCAICSKECSKALAADHDHTTGIFRGLLCNNCNRGLGHLQDDITLLQKAIDYLKGTK